MKNYVIDCFDEHIQREISKLNEKLNMITPDNFNYLDSRVLELNDKLSTLNYTYSGLNMINSIDTSKLNTMLVHAKTGGMQFKAVSVLSFQGDNNTIFPLPDWIKQNHKKMIELNIDTPAGFTGLQSFVVLSPLNLGTVLKEKKKSKLWVYKNDRDIKIHIKMWASNLVEIFVVYWK